MNMLMSRFRFMTGFVASLFVFLSGSLAQATLISVLMDTDGELVNGDKVFSEFTYLATGDMPSADLVNVVSITDDDGNLGIRFQGAFVDLFGGGGGSDALITYKVTSLGAPIIDVHLAANTAVVGVPGEKVGFMGITETFIPDDTELSLAVFDIEPGSRSLVARGEFSEPHQILRVQKDILAFSASEGTAATVSFVDQTFSQVPEPSTVVLAGVALLSLLWIRIFRRRR